MAVLPIIAQQTALQNKAIAPASPLTGNGAPSIQTNTSYKSPIPNLGGSGLNLSTPANTQGLTGNIVNPQIPKPTTAVSSKTAVNGPVNTAKQVTANPPQQPLYNAANGYVTPYGLSQGAKPVNPGDPAMASTTSTVPPLTTQNQSSNTPTSTPGNPTAEDQVLHEGQTQLYNNTSGQAEWVDNSKITNGTAPGYTATNPQTVAVTGSVQDNNNNTLNQYADGHYGLVDSAGNYVNITSQTYNNAKAVSDAQKALTDLQNGILTPDQQSQVNNLIAIQQKDMSDLVALNANITGGKTVAENLYGMGNTVSGQGEITKTILDGAQRVKVLQAAQQTAIQDMKNAFQTNDTKALQTAYDNYQGSVTSIKDEINTMATAVANQQIKVDNANTSINTSMAKKYTDTTDPILPTDTAAQRQAKLQTSPTWQADTTIKSVLNPDENDWYADFVSTGAAKNLSLPGGRSAQGIAQNTPIIKAMIAKATAAGISGSQFGAALQDKVAAAHALDLMTKQGANLQAQEDKVTQDISQLEQKANEVSTKEWQSNIPALQKYIQGIDVNFAPGSSQAYIDYAGLLKTTMTAYARVINSQTGSAGTSVNMNEEVQSLIPPGSNPKVAISYLKNTAIPEMQHTTDSYKNTQEDLGNTIASAIGSQNFGAQGSNLSTSSNSSTTGIGSGGLYDF